MHKEEAGLLFSCLGYPDRVKIVKLLYHNDNFTIQQLLERMNLEAVELDGHLQALSDAGLIKKEGYYCSCNKELVENLMSFITTKCSCC